MIGVPNSIHVLSVMACWPLFCVFVFFSNFSRISWNFSIFRDIFENLLQNITQSQNSIYICKVSRRLDYYFAFSIFSKFSRISWNFTNFRDLLNNIDIKQYLLNNIDQRPKLYICVKFYGGLIITSCFRILFEIF